MGRCLSCGAKTKDGAYTCVTCHFKYGASHVIISQEEYQTLRYKEMIHDAANSDNEDKH